MSFFCYCSGVSLVASMSDVLASHRNRFPRFWGATQENAIKAKEDPFKQFSDFEKNLAQMKIPGIDPDELVTVYEQNVAAVTQANRTFLTGMQAFAEKQAAMLQESLKNSETAIKEAAEAGDPLGKKELEHSRSDHGTSQLPGHASPSRMNRARL